jgi:hypothetical protein
MLDEETTTAFHELRRLNRLNDPLATACALPGQIPTGVGAVRNAIRPLGAHAIL